MSSQLRPAWLVCLLAFVSVGCSDNVPTPSPSPPPPSASAKPTELRKVKLLLNWTAEAEHGGFYAAQVHGYYRDEGLDVEIVEGGVDVPVVQQVASKAMDFGIANADQVIFGRAQQAPIVAVMAPLQTSPRCIIVHEKSGIKKFEDIQNMTVAMSPKGAFSHYLRKKFPFKDVQSTPYLGNVAKFLTDEKYAQQGYVFSEPFLIKQQGGDPHVLMVSDVGFNPYTSCIIAHDDAVAKDPEMVRNLVQASIKGWQQYLKEPEQTNQAIHKLNPEMSLEVLAFGVNELKPLVEDPVAKEHGIGHMTEERWQTLVNQLIEVDQLAADKVKASELFTTQFLRADSK